jgi:hypothetical protein
MGVRRRFKEYRLHLLVPLKRAAAPQSLHPTVAEGSRPKLQLSEVCDGSSRAPATVLAVRGLDRYSTLGSAFPCPTNAPRHEHISGGGAGPVCQLDGTSTLTVENL